MLEIACALGGIEEVILLGDFADFYSVSRHLRDPRLPHMLHEEVESVNLGLDEIDRLFPKARKVFLEGNHEVRLETYLFSHAPALFGLASCKGLFQISHRPKWSYLPFGRSQAYPVLGSDLLARHRPLASNAKSGLQRAAASVCYGDIHKIEQAHTVGLDSKVRVAFCPGWLGDPRLKAFDYMLAPPQWQHGFAIVSVDGSSKEFHHEIIEIKNNSAIVWGKKYKSWRLSS